MELNILTVSLLLYSFAILTEYTIVLTHYNKLYQLEMNFGPHRMSEDEL